jgi:predicted RNA-binding protein (TIGR00451 family)
MFIVVETATFPGVLHLQTDLVKVRSIADYQFGKGVGKILFPKGVTISYSRRTGRIRYVHLNRKRLATLRPTDGLFSLSLEGAQRIVKISRSARCFVTVQDDVSEFIADGSDVFAVHVVRAHSDIRAKDEVIVIDKNHQVLAVGRAVLSGEEMTAFKRGVAVKVRRGAKAESYV